MKLRKLLLSIVSLVMVGCGTKPSSSLPNNTNPNNNELTEQKTEIANFLNDVSSLTGFINFEASIYGLINDVHVRDVLANKITTNINGRCSSTIIKNITRTETEIDKYMEVYKMDRNELEAYCDSQGYIIDDSNGIFFEESVETNKNHFFFDETTKQNVEVNIKQLIDFDYHLDGETFYSFADRMFDLIDAVKWIVLNGDKTNNGDIYFSNNETVCSNVASLLNIASVFPFETFVIRCAEVIVENNVVSKLKVYFDEGASQIFRAYDIEAYISFSNFNGTELTNLPDPSTNPCKHDSTSFDCRDEGYKCYCKKCHKYLSDLTPYSYDELTNVCTVTGHVKGISERIYPEELLVHQFDDFCMYLLSFMVGEDKNYYFPKIGDTKFTTAETYPHPMPIIESITLNESIVIQNLYNDHDHFIVETYKSSTPVGDSKYSVDVVTYDIYDKDIDDVVVYQDEIHEIVNQEETLANIQKYTPAYSYDFYTVLS